jgi:hypothetical protein
LAAFVMVAHLTVQFFDHAAQIVVDVRSKMAVEWCPKLLSSQVLYRLLLRLLKAKGLD